MTPPCLTVVLHLAGGQTDCFELDDAASVRVLVDQLNPTKVFSAPSLTISEQDCLTAYRTQQIVRIDVGGTDVPTWPYLGKASSVTEVSPDEFALLTGTEDLVKKRLEAWKQPGTAQQGFTTLELAGGQRIIWQVDMVSSEMMALDSLSIVRHLLGAGALHGLRADGSVMIINMAHVVRLSFHPGPPSTSTRIASARRIAE
ncbi:MAG: hypothetical protein ACLQVD_15385 [Capsulimonadaceae bacterium]